MESERNHLQPGIRYQGVAGTAGLHTLPSPLQIAVDDCVRDFRKLDRGKVRRGNDRTHDSRANHCVNWLLKRGATITDIREWPDDVFPLLFGAYLKALCNGDNLQHKEHLAPKTITGYIRAGQQGLSIIRGKEVDIRAPPMGSTATKPGYHPIIKAMLQDHQTWNAQTAKKCEPITHQIRAALQHATSFPTKYHPSCTVHAAVLDWTTLGTFAGCRIADYGQTNPTILDPVSLIPPIPSAGEWAGLPIAFIASDMTFYSKDMHKINIASVPTASWSHIEYLHLRFRFDKSPNNFTIRKFRRSSDKELCPVTSAISIMRRAILLKLKPHQPLAAYRRERTGELYYLSSAKVTQRLRQATISAYPNPTHYLRQHLHAIRSHSCRVTAAVCLDMMGVSIPAIAHRLRWVEASVTHYIRESQVHVDQLTVNGFKGARVL